jgi:hypothetical protein
MPKVQSWGNRIGAIIAALGETEATVLGRSDMEDLSSCGASSPVLPCPLGSEKTHLPADGRPGPG